MTSAPAFLNFLPASATYVVVDNSHRLLATQSPVLGARNIAPELPSELDDFATSDEIAHLERRSRKTVERWAREGQIPAIKVGDKWLFPRPAIILWDSLRSRQAHTEHAFTVFVEQVAQMLQACPPRMSPAQASNLLRIESRTFKDQCREGRMFGIFKRGRDWYLDREELRTHIVDATRSWLANER